MRDILFRVWDGNRMTSQIRLEFAHGLRLVSTDDLGFDMVGDDKCILMQSTGLLDKNGVLIYEGDIVRILYTDWGSQTPNEKGIYELSLEDYKKSISDIGFVEWGQVNWQINFGKGRFGEDEHGSLIEGIHGEKEIIGNIYENPELIKS